MTPAEYRFRKDDLIRRENDARNRAQLAAVAVEEAKARGEDALADAQAMYRIAVGSLEDLMHLTGEFDG